MHFFVLKPLNVTETFFYQIEHHLVTLIKTKKIRLFFPTRKYGENKSDRPTLLGRAELPREYRDDWNTQNERGGTQCTVKQNEESSTEYKFTSSTFPNSCGERKREERKQGIEERREFDQTNRAICIRFLCRLELSPLLPPFFPRRRSTFLSLFLPLFSFGRPFLSLGLRKGGKFPGEVVAFCTSFHLTPTCLVDRLVSCARLDTSTKLGQKFMDLNYCLLMFFSFWCCSTTIRRGK